MQDFLTGIIKLDRREQELMLLLYIMSGNRRERQEHTAPSQSPLLNLPLNLPLKGRGQIITELARLFDTERCNFLNKMLTLARHQREKQRLR